LRKRSPVKGTYALVGRRVKGKVHARPGYESPEVERRYISTLS